MLKVSHVKKSFKKLAVLKDISLETQAGELVHISGVNGCGKSTLFKIIVSLLKADSGEIHTDKDDYLGALIENPGFIEYETAWDNLTFLGHFNHRFQPEKTRDLLKPFDLDPDNPQSVGNYSVGMRQKLGITQAVMEDQNIILLDEPTRGIDKEGVDQLVNLMKDLRSENKTVIVASHDEIPGLVYDRRLRMKDGILLAEE
ncbi:ATP-binding cassette domain-containing protein [Lactobacillus delbrueckii subsp. lactis]|uniref:ABC transporter ATP-binding protein n=1 Tax=Lactobacillus delbrueckii TaxID=1584 RepID=UPI001E470429|nr:ATP-binding cassette domain-containing protein [Lactobacillus delbrueckii]MCD9218234.1 ATP-binding cassette domain-containing protein [Lactobacillus delbrueckii subsp. lactis]